MRIPLLSLATIGLLLAAPCSGQRLFDIGLKGGVNQDDLATRYSHSPVLGGHVGLFVRVKPPILPGVQGEVLLSSMGTNVRIEDVDVDVRSLTLQLPLMLVLSLGPVELHAGGYYDHQLARSLDAKLHLDVGEVPLTVDDLRDGTFGLLGGAGIHLGRFYAAGRYNHGLQSIGTGEFLGDVKSRQVQVYLAWGFVK